MKSSSYVTVALRIGSAVFSRCTADVFTTDTLTISSIDDGAEIRVLGPGQWHECIVFDARNDHPLFGFTSKTACAQILSQVAQRGIKAVA